MLHAACQARCKAIRLPSRTPKSVDSNGIAFLKHMQQAAADVFDVVHAQVVEAVLHVAPRILKAQPCEHALHTSEVATIDVAVSALDVDPLTECRRSPDTTNVALCVDVVAIPISARQEHRIAPHLVQTQTDRFEQPEAEVVKHGLEGLGRGVGCQILTLEKLGRPHESLETSDLSLRPRIDGDDRELNDLVLPFEVKHQQVPRGCLWPNLQRSLLRRRG
mmetsp:Transcript_171128/g.548467  ORF Transcript_171128/g.548467 Transcript_171128/m.548467 type:complete len:220 (-) Transcript_171128:849-1508(-)